MTRAAALVVAVLGVAFFAVVVVQDRSSSAAIKRLERADPPGRTASLIDRAGLLNPGSDVDLLRARLALQRKDVDEARRVLLDVVTLEPANLQAWATIAVAFESDRALYRRAEAAVAKWSPEVPEP